MFKLGGTIRRIQLRIDRPEELALRVISGGIGDRIQNEISGGIEGPDQS